jgi:hypothetical protein
MAPSYEPRYLGEPLPPIVQGNKPHSFLSPKASSSRKLNLENDLLTKLRTLDRTLDPLQFVETRLEASINGRYSCIFSCRIVRSFMKLLIDRNNKEKLYS